MADRDFFRNTPDGIEDCALVANEYEAGYRMRLDGETEFKTATASWRAGWQDADRELLQAGFTLSNTRSSAPICEQWSLYGTGSQARACELPFDVNRGEAWKRSWVAADIQLGLTERQRSSC